MTKEEAKDYIREWCPYDRQEEIIQALEQEPILDKIRERISLEKLGYPPSAEYYKAIVKVLQILDKYKAESEEQE